MQDKVFKYFKQVLEDYAFIEFTSEYIKKSGKINFMQGIPVPVKKEDLAKFADEGEFKFDVFAEAMVHIMGSDINFKYNDKYIQYMKVFNPKILNFIIKEGLDSAEEDLIMRAAIHLRAALVMDPDSLDAVYNYARACRHLYEKSEDPEYVADFKAEATLYFEYTVERHPGFAQAYYFLGYAYINANLYVKAQMTWDKFMRLSRNRKDKAEIKQRLLQIKRLVNFERGYTAVLAGKWKDGLFYLEPLADYDPNWWNLFFFLGVAYSRTGNTREALELFKRVIEIKPSQAQAMAEMAVCYEDLGEKEMALKYRKKAELVAKQQEE
ncbi:MAG: tetratricopeptide repeat protein [Eubacteriales bacterium]